MSENIADYNLFMCCTAPNPAAFSALPEGYRFDFCLRDELPLWKAFPFDDEETARIYEPSMDAYFHRVYGKQEQLFFHSCLFVRDSAGVPVGTAFLWRAYGKINTLHWLKVRRDCEGKGLGRAILTRLLSGLSQQELPVCLHTQPGSFRAVKLYTEFGFSLLTDETIGARKNQLTEGLPYLKSHMPAEAFAALTFARAPQSLLDAARDAQGDEF